MSEATVQQAERLEDEDYQAALARLREYREMVEAADRRADQASLARAADLALLYEDRRWMDELPAAKPDVTGKVTPDSRNRFAKWVAEVSSVHLQTRQTTYLLGAYDLNAQVSTVSTVVPTGERVLRPLKAVQSKGYDHLEVWRRAVELAEGRPPTEAQVRQAKTDYLAQFTPKDQRNRARRHKWQRQHDLIVGEFRALLRERQFGVAYDTLQELVTEYENQRTQGQTVT